MIKQKKKSRIIIASHGFTEDIYKVGSIHYARELNKLENEVLLISSPLSIIHFLGGIQKRFVKRFLTLCKGIYVTKFGYKEYIPFTLMPFLWKKPFDKKFLLSFQKFALIGFRRNLHRNNFLKCDVLIIENPAFLWLLKFVHYQKLVYRITDIYSQMIMSNKIYSHEKYLLIKSDMIITTSIGIKEFIEKRYDVGKKIFSIENGVDMDHFSYNENQLPKEISFIEELDNKIIYLGAIDFRIDVDLIEELSENLENYNFILAGHVTTNVSKLKQKRNVHLIGSIDYNYVPSLFRKCLIGILPFRLIESNHGRSPMKLYEYGISGLPVVTTKTRDIELKNENFVFSASDPKEFLFLIKRLTANYSFYSRAAFESSKIKSWHNKTLDLLDLLSMETNADL